LLILAFALVCVFGVSQHWLALHAEHKRRVISILVNHCLLACWVPSRSRELQWRLEGYPDFRSIRFLPLIRVVLLGRQWLNHLRQSSLFLLCIDESACQSLVLKQANSLTEVRLTFLIWANWLRGTWFRSSTLLPVHVAIWSSVVNFPGHVSHGVFQRITLNLIVTNWRCFEDSSLC